MNLILKVELNQQSLTNCYFSHYIIIYLPSKAWNSLDLKIRMTRSMAIRRVRSCGADKREW